MSCAGRTAIRSIVALLVTSWLGACDSGDGDADEELVPRDCACCEYAEEICTIACDCDTSDQCALLYPSGNYQAWTIFEVCVAKMITYCRDHLVSSAMIKVCDSALATAECVETDQGPALAVPTACLD